MALSERLMDLAARTRGLEEAAEAARGRNVVRMEAQREQLRSKVAEAKGDAQARWNETTAKIERRRAELQASREQHKHERRVEAAQAYAGAAEEFASALTSLAAYTADAAAEATVDAGIAREHADSMARDQAPTA